jgi:hypothetical protein
VFQRKTETQSADETQKSGGALAGRLSGGLSSLMQRSGSLVDRVAGSVKEVAGSGLHRQALDARDRGNLAAAYYLIAEESGARPDDIDVAASFWDIAVQYERAVDALAAGSLLVRHHAIAGAIELASQYWIELSAAIPDALVEPSTFARVLPGLSEYHETLDAEAAKLAEIAEGADDEEIIAEAAAASERRDLVRGALVLALRGMVDERNSGLTPGLAMHAAELARELDPQSALLAARHALDCDDLHQAKRERMQRLVSELDPDAPPPPPPSADELDALPGKSSEAGPGAEEPGRARGEGTASHDEEGYIEAELHIPAKNHPLFTDESPPHPGLSEEQLREMRKRLPPSRSTPAPVAASAQKAAEEQGDEKDDELDDELDEETLEAGRSGDDEGETDGAAEQEPARTDEDLPGADMSLVDPLFLDVKVIPGEPIALEEGALSLSVGSDRSVRIEFEKIQALAVGEVWGLAEEPVLIIDLLLNWRTGKGDPLRAVRMRTDCFAPEELMPDESDPGSALRALLACLLEGSSAIPLPDPDGALGLVVPVYQSLLEYEREVLQLRV